MNQKQISFYELELKLKSIKIIRGLSLIPIHDTLQLVRVVQLLKLIYCHYLEE